MDFESVLELTAAILAEHRAAAAEVADRYRYFVVDEYQDVNPLQKLLLDAWTGGRDDVCVVGDPRQTIYSFTGATPAYLTGFPPQFPHATVIRLVRNYRSTPQVVALANRLTGSAGGRRMAPPRDEPLPGGAPLVGHRAAGPEPEFTGYADEAAEAARSPPGPPSSSRRASRPARWPCWSGSTPDRALRAGAGRGGGAVPGARGGAVLRPARGAPGDGAAAGRRGVRPGRAPRSGRGGGIRARRGRGPARAGRPRPDQETATAAGARPGSAGSPWTRWPSSPTTSSPPRPARGWPTWRPSSRTERDRARTGPDGVTLASLHAAKGLEWDVVFLPGLTEGNLPIIYAQTDEAIEEERRLLYVGVTRARERLYLSWALARSPGGRPTRKPSRFLDGLRPRRLAGGAGDRRARSPGATPGDAGVPAEGARRPGRYGSPVPAWRDEAPAGAADAGP